MGGRVVRIVTRLNRGGPLRQLEALVPGLEASGWTGPLVHGPTTGHETDGAARLRASGARLLRVRSLQRGLDTTRDARALRALLAVLRHERPDVVHTHMGKAGALGRLAASIAGIPCVHTYHGHHFAAPWPRDALAVAAERRLARLTSAAVALTPRQQRDLVAVHRILPAERVHVIPPGLDVDAWRRCAAEGALGPRQAALFAANRSPVFLWAGRFVAVKRPDLVLDAVARSREPFRVVMLGGGPLRRRLHARVVDEGLAERIALPGEVEDPAPWMQAADALVLTSDSEGAPLAILEAKALGRPTVATAVGGVCDLVEHGVDGLWVPPDDAGALATALDRLAADPDLLRALGRRAEVDVDARYGAKRLAEKTAALYERVRAWRGRPPRHGYHPGR